jgi:class 3 adenylate cyclase
VFYFGAEDNSLSKQTSNNLEGDVGATENEETNSANDENQDLGNPTGKPTSDPTEKAKSPLKTDRPTTNPNPPGTIPLAGASSSGRIGLSGLGSVVKSASSLHAGLTGTAITSGISGAAAITGLSGLGTFAQGLPSIRGAEITGLSGIGSVLSSANLWRNADVLKDYRISIGSSDVYGTQITPYVVPADSKDILEKRIEKLDEAKLKLSDENKGLKANIEKIKSEVNEIKEDRNLKDAKIKELDEKIQKHNLNESLRHLVDRIHPDAVKLLGESKKFREEFEGKSEGIIVLAIDIRRSTELMLKARSPYHFSKFITELCIQLAETIKTYWGVFDKFTGDGILAFFPKFYSGEDSILKAISAAIKCHDIFKNHYQENRNCFNAVLTDIGLGIGIDSGEANIVTVSGGLTVVGTPVVYACRMSSAKAGDTLLNQPAYEKAYPKYSEFFDFSETEIDVKHEGKTLAYKVVQNKNRPEIEKPNFDPYRG